MPSPSPSAGSATAVVAYVLMPWDLASQVTYLAVVFVAPGVLTSNDNYMGRTEERKEHFGGPRIRRGARLGVGAVVLPGKEIPEEAVVAAGAVLTRDAEAGQVHIGVPARPTGPVPSEQRLDADG